MVDNAKVLGTVVWSLSFDTYSLAKMSRRRREVLEWEQGLLYKEKQSFSFCVRANVTSDAKQKQENDAG